MANRQNKMEKQINQVVNFILDSAILDEDELLAKIENNKNLPEYDGIKSFFFAYRYPYEQFLAAVIRQKIGTNSFLETLMLNSQFFQTHFEWWIENIEGSVCCADKSRAIMEALVKHFQTGNLIAWDYGQEYTFHLPKKVFTTHSEIINFAESLRGLIYGIPDKYIAEIANLDSIKEKYNPPCHT